MENGFRQHITGLQHIGLPTNDIESTIAFYEALGFEAVLQTVNEKAGEKVAFLRLGNITIETYENKQVALSNGAWDHVALNVTDIEAVFQAAKEKGLHILDSEIQFLPFWDHGVRFFTITGPNQEKVEFSQYLQED